MRLISFNHSGEARFGVIEGDAVLDATEAAGGRSPSLLALLRAGALEDLRAATLPGAGARRHRLADVEWLEPIPGAPRIFCVGANYPKEHPLGGQVEAPAHPSVFQKAAEALVPHGGALRLPAVSEQLDYEGELAVVVGRGGASIPEKEALAHVAGYTCMNDGSVRDFQKHSVWAGKNFARSGAIGPWLVTADEVGDPARLTLVTRLNGEEVQRSGLDRMFFSVQRILSYLSEITPLLPGDVVAMGSPEGSGAQRQPPRWLKPGDRVEVEIAGVGLLSNRVE